MKLIYIDESGYAFNWKENISDLPFHVVSAFCIDASTYHNSIDKLISDLNLKGFDITIGKEIKAKKAFSNSLYFLKRGLNCKHDELIKVMLSFPSKYNGVAWSVAFNKKKWLDKNFRNDIEPQLLCLNDLFERIQLYLNKNNDAAICIIDQNKKLDDKVYDTHKKITLHGSYFPSGSSISKQSYQFKMDRILEVHLGNSSTCVGLKIVDFIARGTFQVLKEKRRGDYKSIPWLKDLINSLDRSDKGKIMGWGFKQIPKNS